MNPKRPYLLCALASLAFAFPATAAVPSAEQLLPEDTIAVLSAPDLSHLGNITKGSAMGRLWNDDALAPFREKLLKKLDEDVLQKLKQEAGIDLEEYAGLLQGQVTLAVTLNGWTGGESPVPGVLLIADTGSKADQLRTKLTEVRDKIRESGETLRTEEVRGTEFSLLQPPAGGPPVAIRFGQAGSLLLVSLNANPSDLDQVLARLGGGSSPCLADEAAFRQDQGMVFRDALAFGWVHTAPLIEILMQKLAEESANQEGFGPKPDMIVKALGLTGLQTLAIGTTSDATGEKAHLFMGVPESQRSGLLAIPAAVQGDASPPAFISAEVAGFTRTRLSGAKLWESIEGIANGIMPGALDFGIAQFESGIKESNPDFNLRRDIIGNLGDDLVSWQNAPRENTVEGLGAQPSITLLGSPNPSRLLDSLKTVVTTAIQLPFEDREFLGRKIYDLTIPFAQGPDGPMTLSLCASGSYLAIGMDKGLMEEYLRSADSGAKPLAARAGLTQAAEAVGGMRTGLFGYQNDSMLMRAVIETLRTEGNDFLNLFAGEIPVDTSEARAVIGDWLDFSLLPSYDRVAKYFDLTVFSGQAGSAGYSLKFFTPMPSGLR
ncbi:MAG: hypothetical protein H7A46_16665 [Verrucomicrobiales bacterium]|nr:hypothetical protein [Verrucomicrobiales bacterium]